MIRRIVNSHLITLSTFKASSQKRLAKRIVSNTAAHKEPFFINCPNLQNLYFVIIRVTVNLNILTYFDSNRISLVQEKATIRVKLDEQWIFSAVFINYGQDDDCKYSVDQ